MENHSDEEGGLENRNGLEKLKCERSHFHTLCAVAGHLGYLTEYVLK